jgi:hypothetical protein
MFSRLPPRPRMLAVNCPGRASRVTSTAVPGTLAIGADQSGDENHLVGHHMSGSKISAPENCGTPQVMVATFDAPKLPTPPSVDVAVIHQDQIAPAPFHSVPNTGARLAVKLPPTRP